MILDRDLKNKFTIFLFFSNVEQGTKIKSLLSATGYDCYLLTDSNMVAERVQQAAPHILLFSLASLDLSLSEFVKGILHVNKEIRMVPIAPESEYEALLDYREYNFDRLVMEGTHFESRLTWAIDDICLMLYRIYQNEQLYVELKHWKQVGEEAQKTLNDNLEKALASSSENLIAETVAASVQSGSAAPSSALSSAGWSKSLETSQTEEEVLSVARGLFPTNGFYFLKYLSSEAAFAEGEQKWPLSIEEQKDPTFLLKGQLPQEVQKYFKANQVAGTSFVRPLLIQKKLLGLIVVFAESSESTAAGIEDQLNFVRLKIENFYLNQVLRGTDKSDAVTGLPTLEFYHRKLKEELERSERIKKPLSLIKLSVDSAVELQASRGPILMQHFLLVFAQILKQSLRVNDFICRTGEFEFSIILPHSSVRGAALKAERLRRQIESFKFEKMNAKMTASFGVAEYPTCATSESGLEASALQALEMVIDQSGNRVCVAHVTAAAPEVSP